VLKNKLPRLDAVIDEGTDTPGKVTTMTAMDCGPVVLQVCADVGKGLNTTRSNATT